jgi:hypothetical protein
MKSFSISEDTIKIMGVVIDQVISLASLIITRDNLDGSAISSKPDNWKQWLAGMEPMLV